MKIFALIRKDAPLIYHLFRANIRDKYLGSSLGIGWAVLQPVLFLAMYTVVFGFVLKSKVPGAEKTLTYVIWLLSGLVPYMAFAEAITSSAMSIVSGSQMIKNIAFRSENLTLASVFVSVVPFLVGLFFLLILTAVNGHYPGWEILALIPVIILQYLFLAGLGLFLGATAPFLRDITQILPTLTMLWLFFTPIFYPLEMMPGIVQKLTFFNPLFHLTQPYRDILIHHQWPDARGIAYLTILAFGLLFGSLRYFRKLKGHFETVI